MYYGVCMKSRIIFFFLIYDIIIELKSRNLQETKILVVIVGGIEIIFPTVINYSLNHVTVFSHHTILRRIYKLYRFQCLGLKHRCILLNNLLLFLPSFYLHHAFTNTFALIPVIFCFLLRTVCKNNYTNPNDFLTVIYG